MNSFKIFLIIVASHFLEHVSQMIQLYIFHWYRPDCLGLLGLAYPWLITSEWFHYGHALFMLLGLTYFRFSPVGGWWWQVALWLAFYHHIEHMILLDQAIIGIELAARQSLGSFLMPRIELHFFYNLMVLVPMLVAMRGKKADAGSLYR